jgi:prepilin-type N-terminal cleavage/methylation domain-containing protein
VGVPAKRTASGAGAGFSMVELIVALAITLVVTGAIYQLLTSSQNAFRREPEITERQQNIRVAIDLMVSDVMAAGSKVPAWLQVFDPNQHEAGPAGPRTTGGCPGGTGCTDKLAFLGQADGSCPDVEVCRGGNGASIDTYTPVPGCLGIPGPALFWTAVAQPPPGNCNASPWPCGCVRPPCAAVLWACTPGPGQANACHTEAGTGHMIVPKGQGASWNPSGGPPFVPEYVSAIGVNKWEIRIDPEGVPNLWRSGIADLSAGDLQGAPTQCAPRASAGRGWAMVARGIEDLRIDYLTQANFAAGSWQPVPGSLREGDYGSVVRQVRITLSARSLARRLAGATTRGSAGEAVRGTLTQEVTPRNSLLFLSRASPTSLYQ